MPKLNICLVAGEASGDVQGALLVQALCDLFARQGLSCHFWGVGGPQLRALGFETLLTTEELAVMGFAEIVSSFSRISKAYKLLLYALETRKPDLLVLVDYPGFNLRLAADAFARSLPVVYHIAPKVWAHGSHRATTLAENTHVATCILPFEETYLRKRGVNAHFVGNPLRDNIAEFTRKNPSRARLSEAHFNVGLLPGSRRSEIHYVLPPLVQAFAKLQDTLALQTTNEVKGIVPVASTLSKEWVQEEAVRAAQLCGKNEAWVQKNILFLDGQSHHVMQNADYAWVCSGTASLETAFFGTPLSVIYKMSPFTYVIAKNIIKVPYVGLVNLCANRELVPEFLQHHANVENLVGHALQFLAPSPLRTKMQSELLALRDMFPEQSAARAAELLVSVNEKFGANVDSAKRFQLQDSARVELLSRYRDAVPFGVTRGAV